MNVLHSPLSDSRLSAGNRCPEFVRPKPIPLSDRFPCAVVRAVAGYPTSATSRANHAHNLILRFRFQPIGGVFFNRNPRQLASRSYSSFVKQFLDYSFNGAF
jgi:hypothetical protein